MPIANCSACGHDRFAVELRAVSLQAGDARMQARSPVQVCLKCGFAQVEYALQVEQGPPPDQPAGQPRRSSAPRRAAKLGKRR